MPPNDRSDGRITNDDIIAEIPKDIRTGDKSGDPLVCWMGKIKLARAEAIEKNLLTTLEPPPKIYEI